MRPPIHLKRLEKKAKKETASIALDWMSMYFIQTNHFPEIVNDNDTISINEDFFLLGVNKGTPDFNSRYKIIFYGEEVGTLLLNGRNEKIFKKDKVKLELINHTLYSGQWLDIVNIIKKHGLYFDGFNRVDIAIDGTICLHRLLNFYAKEEKKDEVIILKNSTDKRAIFNSKVLNPKTRLYENFTIGSAKGIKYITVYNKSLELAKSGKKYIQEYWLLNGVIKSLADTEKQIAAIKAMDKKGQELLYLNGFENIYRFELRLKARAMKEVKNFKIEMLTTVEGLASIVKLHCKKFFEPVYKDYAKIEKCTPIDIVPWQNLKATVLQKVKPVIVDGDYNAKQVIRGTIKEMYRNRLSHNKIRENLETIFDRIEFYKLAKHTNDRLDEWHKEYFRMITPGRETEVENFITEIIRRLEPMIVGYETIDTRTETDFKVETDQGKAQAKEAAAKVKRVLAQRKLNNQFFNLPLSEKDDLAARHGQAGATAAWGE